MSAEQSKTFLDYARRYMAVGWSVTPLRAPFDVFAEDKQRGKAPYITGWQEAPPTTDAEIEEWFHAESKHAYGYYPNLGLRLGKASNNLVVVDVDGARAMAYLESKLNGEFPDIVGKFKRTYVVKSGRVDGGFHIYFYVNKAEYPDGISSIELQSKNSPDGEITIKGNGTQVVAPPSTHKTGKQYVVFANTINDVQTLNKAEIDKLAAIFKATKPGVKSNVKELLKPDYIKHTGSNRQLDVLKMAGYYARKLLPCGYSKEEILRKTMEWNQLHCEPPLTEGVVADRVDAALEYISEDGSDIIECRRCNEKITFNEEILSESGKLIPLNVDGTPHECKPKPNHVDQNKKQTKYEEMARRFEVDHELLRHIGAVISESPREFVVAHTDDKRIKIASVYDKQIQDEGDKEPRTVHYIRYRDTIIDAIPERITIIKDPLEDTVKYELELASANGEVHTFGPAPFTDLIAAIEKTPLCFKPRSLHGYLAPLLRACIEGGIVEYKTEIDREGFFWVDGKLIGSKIEIKPVTQSQAKAAVGFIDELQKRFYAKDRDTRRLAHCLRLSCVAPFDFARRQMGAAGNNNFIPRLDQYGWANTGKTYGYPKIILRIWRREVEDYLKGNGSVDTAARFIKQTGFSTMPLILDEVDFTNNWEKDGRVQNYIAILKNQCSMTHPRDTLTKDSELVSRPSLAFPILTHNSDRITEDGLVKRYVGFGYTPDDEISKERELAFTAFLDERKEDNGVIGDFVAGYIVAHQELLKQNWEVISKEVLTALYTLAEEKVPDWLWSKVEHASMEDTKEARSASIKAATLEMINLAWAQNRAELGDKNNPQIPDLKDKIELLATYNLLPHLRLHKTEGVCLLSSFVETLKEKYKITRISMAQLAAMCGWENKPVRLGDGASSSTTKVVRVSLEGFVSFLTEGSYQMEVA